MTDQPTKEEMLDYLKRVGRIYNSPIDLPAREAIRALISASPEAGEKRGEATDLTPSDAEMQKHYDRGEMASPAPLPAEVEAAMKRIGTAMDDAYYGREEYAGVHEASDKKIDDWAALATLRAALTEARQPKVVSAGWVERWANELWLADTDGHLTTPETIRAILRELGLTVEEPK